MGVSGTLFQPEPGQSSACVSDERKEIRPGDDVSEGQFNVFGGVRGAGRAATLIHASEPLANAFGREMSLPISSKMIDRRHGHGKSWR